MKIGRGGDGVIREAARWGEGCVLPNKFLGTFTDTDTLLRKMNERVD
jgi:hypothetical protein